MAVDRKCQALEYRLTVLSGIALAAAEGMNYSVICTRLVEDGVVIMSSI